MKNIKKKKNMILIIAIILIVSTGVVGTLAKYTNIINSFYSQASSSFYFTSNYLTSEEPIYEIYTNQINIEIYNYDLKNIANVSSTDIIYNTSIKYYDASNILIGEEIITTNNSNWTDDDYGSYSLLELNYIDDASYAIVSVNSISPYNKEIRARFNFNFTDFVPTYSVNDLTNGFTIKIMTANEDLSNVLVQWPTQCGPDNTNPYMSLWTTGSNSDYLNNLVSNTTYTFNFYCALAVVYVNFVDETVLSNSAISVTLE